MYPLPSPYPWAENTFVPLVFGLGYVTCFGQCSVGDHESSWACLLTFAITVRSKGDILASLLVIKRGRAMWNRGNKFQHDMAVGISCKDCDRNQKC